MDIQDVVNPLYWKSRIDETKHLERPEHTMVYICGIEKWKRVEAKHRELLMKYVGSLGSVLDCGCGYGRLLDLMPQSWAGDYVGIDISPDFIDMATFNYPSHEGHFLVGDIRDLGFGNQSFDFGVLISIKHMIIRNCGESEWLKMEAELKRVCKRLLFLEYDETDEGTLV